jgi:ABC-type microcin C transport system duplicated ATPase subunit YejF
MVGGVFRYSLIVREVFRNTMSSLDPRLEVNRQVVEPVAGALMMARKAHVQPAEEVK